jgi:hypothetical protein
MEQLQQLDSKLSLEVTRLKSEIKSVEFTIGDSKVHCYAKSNNHYFYVTTVDLEKFFNWIEKNQLILDQDYCLNLVQNYGHQTIRFNN